MNTTINWIFLLFAYASLFIMGLIDNSRGPLYPQILDQLHITSAQGAYIFTLASLSGLIINLTSRYWLPKMGASRGIVYSLLFMALGSFIMGLAPTIFVFLPPIIILYIASFILGIGLSGSGICMNILVSLAVPEKIKQRAFAGLHATYGIASFIAPGLIYLSTKYQLTWNIYFIYLALLPLCIAIIFYIKLPPKNILPQESNMDPPLPIMQRLPYAIIFGSYVAAEILLSSRLTLYLEKVQHMSAQHSGEALSLFFLLLTLGRIMFAVAPLPKWKATKLLKFSLVMSMFLFAMGIILSPWFFALAGLSMSFFFPVGMNWLNSLFTKKANFMIATVMTSIGVALIFSHSIFGIIATKFSLAIAFYLIPLCSCLSLCCLLLLSSSQINPIDEVAKK